MGFFVRKNRKKIDATKDHFSTKKKNLQHKKTFTTEKADCAPDIISYDLQSNLTLLLIELWRTSYFVSQDLQSNKQMRADCVPNIMIYRPSTWYYDSRVIIIPLANCKKND